MFPSLQHTQTEKPRSLSPPLPPFSSFLFPNPHRAHQKHKIEPTDRNYGRQWEDLDAHERRVCVSNDDLPVAEVGIRNVQEEAPPPPSPSFFSPLSTHNKLFLFLSLLPSLDKKYRTDRKVGRPAARQRLAQGHLALEEEGKVKDDEGGSGFDPLLSVCLFFDVAVFFDFL